MDWVKAIGFQHEVLHTAVLAHILCGARAERVARNLTGDDSVVAVREPLREHRLKGRRPIDIAAELVLPDAHASVLAVEVKVDSAWTPQQLVATVPSTSHGVLLALGRTALAVTDEDLRAIDGFSREWKRVGPHEFAYIVHDVMDADPELKRYVDSLHQEAEDQDRALAAVGMGETVDFGRDPTLLGHWAYFSEVVRHRGDASQWERKALRSGPLLTHWVTGDRPDGSGDYIEFMGEHGSRSLCLKTFGPPGAGLLEANRKRLLDLVLDLDPRKTARPSINDKTCTAAKWDLEGRLPRDAAWLCTKVEERLRGSGSAQHTPPGLS